MKKIIVAAIVMCASISPKVASAVFVTCGGYNTDGSKQPDCGMCDLFKLINIGVDVIIKGLIPLAATLIIVYAGFKMIINQGNAEVAQQCRAILLATAIGLVVVFASYAIVGVILESMGAPINGPLDWAPTCS